MFKLKLNPFRFVPFSGLLLLLLTMSTEVNAQFDSIIFARNDIYRPESVVYLGDQNNDGCDDFVICTFYSINGYTGRVLLFYGGNPINPVPAMSFDIYSSAGYGITACDYNRDGYRDLIITTHIIKPLKFKVYLGGPNMDTIPDFIFKVTDNSIGDLQLFGSDWPIDFNGDGFEELITHSYQMYGQKGAFLIYNSAVEIDSIPDRIISYTPEEQISPANITFGDLDGDGRTDLTFLLNSSSIPVNFDLRRFVFGRTDFSFEDTVNFLESFQLVGNNNIIQDINKDGKADLLTHDGQNKYPYWYRIGISYGSRDVNITPEEGFNTQNEGWTYSRSIGDVNGDGYGDFLTSLSYSGGRLFLGGKHKPDDTPIKYYSGTTNIIARVGDVNGDGLGDIGIGVHGEPGAAQGTFYIMSGERVAMAIEDDEVETEDKDEIDELDLTVSPNPTNGQFSVQYTLTDSGVLELEIYDILGQRIYSESSHKEKGTQTEQINLRNHPVTSGIYIVNLTLKKGEKTLTKSVKVQLIK